MEEDIHVEVDEPEISEVDPHFKQLFLKIAGNDSEISAFELQQILNKVISQRTDVKTDGFSMETCRHIISLLDKDGTTKLGLVEFHTLWEKTQKYLDIFRNHDKDNSGTISSHELRGAVTEAGFKLNSDVLQVIVQHYANAQYAIDFDCFMGCLIRLEMLFKMFKTLDKKSSGKIELDIFQWLCLAMH